VIDLATFTLKSNFFSVRYDKRNKVMIWVFYDNIDEAVTDTIKRAKKDKIGRLVVNLRNKTFYPVGDVNDMIFAFIFGWEVKCVFLDEEAEGKR